MPQVDLETLVSACAGGSSHDRKIACEETLPENPPQDPQPPEIPPDFPPESFCLSKDAEFDWLDQNAFFERKDSTKGTSNSTNLNPTVIPSSNSNSNSNSQRFSFNSFKSKASILGLPKLHKTCFIDTKSRRNSKAGNTRLFPKLQSGSSAKPDSSLVEPSSPKVSCMGRVRSKRDRSRRWRNRRRSAELPLNKPDRRGAERGFLSSFGALFRCWRKQPDAPVENSFPTRARDIDAIPAEAQPRKSVEIQPPGLGGMNRFASGRRSGSWVVGEAE